MLLTVLTDIGAVCGRVRITALFLPGGVLSDAGGSGPAAAVDGLRVSRTNQSTDGRTRDRCLEYVASFTQPLIYVTTTTTLF